MLLSITKTSLLLAVACSSFAVAEEIITSDSYFYGDSPPVYPSPRGSGAGDWASAYVKAKAFVAKLSDDEKVNLTAGVTSTTACSGTIQGIPRLGFPGLCLNDAGNGLRGTNYVNSWASGVHVGATWNRDLTKKRGEYMGNEFRTKGVHVMLGPSVGPLGRVAEGGRNWEAFSVDPYLTGALIYETIEGVQSQGVATSIKHFIANEQETDRHPGTNDEGQYAEAVSSNIDDKTMHELYLWPFQDAVHAGTPSIMCSYNRVNNSYACQNSKLLNGLLKTELGFQGYVVSDWGAQHSGIASANAGLDLVMPSSDFWGHNLTNAITNGTMEASRLNDMVTRIIASWYYLGQESGFPGLGSGMPINVSQPHQAVVATRPAAKSTLLQAAVEGHVLVKNIRNTLPLKSPRLLSVFGYDAYAPSKLQLSQGFGFLEIKSPEAYMNGTQYTGGGSGGNSPAYIDAPIDALQRQAYEDGTTLQWDFSSQDPAVDYTSDACLVFVNAYATEGFDRQGLSDPYSDALITNVANKCKSTIVVIHNAGIRLVDKWIDHSNITAVIYAHLPGQDTGRAVVDILYGRSNPSGRLPYTVAKKESDYGGLLQPTVGGNDKFKLFPQSDFSEGVYIDYRAFDKAGIEPLYAFGFGLSYTTFDYSNLKVSKHNSRYSAYPPKASIIPGGNPRLFDSLVTIKATIKNSGRVEGQEVPQLYVSIPHGPKRQLRGFDKVSIKPGKSATVSFTLTRRDFSTWDANAQDWLLQKGQYNIYVGRNSRDLPLSTVLTI
ncbi:glycosyl hydrolase family 3 N terminal domain-containing protein [Aspergillus pseudoustus]|uniref:Probable beta-glucosidase M n=1 Tax=Aspergillus pseudoustus TaxID=1810923 RepID=A0ABR4JS11_9EURO